MLRFRRSGNLVSVVATVLLISLLYPSNVKFGYEFQKGQVWRYDDLVSPFDFTIRKPEESVRQDKALVAREFSPYYIINTELPGAKIKDFEAAFRQQQEALKAAAAGSGWPPERYLEKCVGILNAIYEKGVIKLDPGHQGMERDFVVNIISGNKSNKRTLPGFLTPEQAKAYAAAQWAKEAQTLPPVLQDALEAAISPNIFYDTDFSNRMREDAQAAVAQTKGLVMQGELVVKKGAIVTEEVYEKLVSFREKFEKDAVSKHSFFTVYLGYLLLTALLIGTFMMYVNAYRQEILYNWSHLAFILMWLLVFSYLTWLVNRSDSLSVYVIPYCVAPVVIRHFFTYRLAFFTHVVIVMIAGFLMSEGYQFAFMQIVAGVVAVLAVADARYWSKFFKSVLYIVLTYGLARAGLTLIEEGSLFGGNLALFGWLALNGFLTLLAFPLIPLMEKMFGFTSSISLVELSDVNRPLLRKLAMNAPGTFQHSLQVGNLAEAAANVTGANPLLLRVGALYHDIGKLKNPGYFVENQSGRNPHDDLTRLESARIIINHVPDGEKLAKKYHMAPVLIRFILTHHGTTRTEYFYKKYLQENPEGEADAAQFTYPGPKPVTKEEAILMLADTVEATARSLKDPTGQDIDGLVDKIFDHKLREGQLNQSKLTMNDLEKCREVFKKMLRSIHHVRVEYPE